MPSRGTPITNGFEHPAPFPFPGGTLVIGNEGIERNRKSIEGHTVPRLTSVVDGSDQGGISSEQGWEGARYGSKHRTTIPDAEHHRYPDLVDRNFFAPAPNRLWVADFTYVSTAGGAFLEWMEGKVLPGVEVLTKAK